MGVGNSESEAHGLHALRRFLTRGRSCPQQIQLLREREALLWRGWVRRGPAAELWEVRTQAGPEQPGPQHFGEEAVSPVTGASFPCDAPSTGLRGREQGERHREGGPGGSEGLGCPPSCGPGKAPQRGAPVPTLSPTGKGPEPRSDCGPGWGGTSSISTLWTGRGSGHSSAAHGKGCVPSGIFQHVCGRGAGMGAGVPAARRVRGRRSGTQRRERLLCGEGLPGETLAVSLPQTRASRAVTETGGDEKGFGTSLLNLELGAGTCVTSRNLNSTVSVHFGAREDPCLSCDSHGACDPTQKPPRGGEEPTACQREEC